ncbi:MAG TPA: glutamate 5-kinase, partial [Candidatus Omnitrophota bacterium]|nr:glutamate 5-kinase [Candidatus Omnitrophota bacterium]
MKIGSSLIAAHQGGRHKKELSRLVDQIYALKKKGIDVVLVSSGAIALGMSETKLKKRPVDLALLQTLAAIGQNILMRLYSDLFKKRKIICAQVL